MVKVLVNLFFDFHTASLFMGNANSLSRRQACPCLPARLPQARRRFTRGCIG